MRKRTKQILIAVGALVVVFLILGGTKAAQIRSMIKAGESFAPPPEAVTTADVVAEEWGSSYGAIGSVEAVMGVMLTAEIGGTVRQIRFESGQAVKKGQLLLRMDTSTEQAELASARADSKFAEAELTRTRKLLEVDARSEADLDSAVARAAQAAASVRNVESIIAKKTIRAPFSGRLGIRMVDLGEFLQSGTQIVALESLKKVYVDFRVPQQALAQVEPGLEVEISGDTFADATWTGTIESVDVQVDRSTRNVLVRALVDNADGRLRPGMFVNVKVVLPEILDVVIIPETSILFAPYGDSVFVVNKAKDEASGEEKLTVEQVFVRLGERRGDLRAVESGLDSGQTVVSTGAFKLQNGMAVVIDNSLAPKVSANPQPTNQ